MKRDRDHGAAEQDPRIPLHFGPLAEAAADAALLIEGDAPAPPGRVVARFVAPTGFHPVGCACCEPRGPVAEALGRLFLARARGGPWFSAVQAVTRSTAGRAAVRAALAVDKLIAARYRPG
jgi:hypothetical protein